MVKLKCNNCEHTWQYNGEQEYYCNCPKCMYKVNIKKNKEKINKKTTIQIKE